MDTDQNPPLNTSNDVQSIISDIVSDVPEPSPIADMPVEAPGGGATGVPETPTVKRGRGRPRKNPVSDTTKKPSIVGVQPPVDMSIAAIEPAAEVAVMMVNMSGMVLGGEEGAMKPEEALLAKSGFVAYFKAKGVENVPAWVVLSGALAPYYLRIVTQTKAKTTITRAGSKIAGGVKKIFGRFRNARFNNRYDTKRKDDTSEKDSETSES